MKLPEYYCLIVGMAAALLANGCSSTADPKTEEKKPELTAITAVDLHNAVKAGTQMGDTLLKALKTKNYALIATVPVGDEKAKLTEAKFNSLVKNLDKAGGIADSSYLGDLAYGNYRRLLWKVCFKGIKGKAQQPDMLFDVVVIRLNGQYRVAGFGFRP